MESEVIGLQSLFEFKIDSVSERKEVVGSLRSTGLRPTFLDKFEKRDIKLPAGLFQAPLPERAVAPVSPMAARLGAGR